MNTDITPILSPDPVPTRSLIDEYLRERREWELDHPMVDPGSPAHERAMRRIAEGLLHEGR